MQNVYIAHKRNLCKFVRNELITTGKDTRL